MVQTGSDLFSRLIGDKRPLVAARDPADEVRLEVVENGEPDDVIEQRNRLQLLHVLGHGVVGAEQVHRDVVGHDNVQRVVVMRQQDEEHGHESVEPGGDVHPKPTLGCVFLHQRTWSWYLYLHEIIQNVYRDATWMTSAAMVRMTVWPL